MRVHRRLRSIIQRIWPPKPKPVILTYHRIADDLVDHWCLAVSPARFEEQLHVLRRTRYPLPLANFVGNLIAGTLAPNAVALTFDDGYVDNLVAGKPRLAAAEMPATVFLATGYLNRAGEFWWDELARLVLLGNAPRTFAVEVRGEAMPFDVGGEPPGRDDSTIRTAALPRRRFALTTLQRAISRLDEKERDLVMAKLRSIFARSDICSGRAMTSHEVRSLVKDGLVTIGAHTITHPVLSQITMSDRHHEISGSKLACEKIIDAPIAGFAYPYGDFDARTREVVKAAGFALACSTQRGPTVATSDVFAMPRIHVLNWGGDTFERVLRSVSAD